MVLRRELDVKLKEQESEILKHKLKIKECTNEIFKFDQFGDELLEKEQKLEKDYEFAFRKTWRSRFTGNSMIASIQAFNERYDLRLVFCNKKKTADIMLEVFYKAVEEHFVEVS